jgi:hypothetical protein
MSNYNCTFCNKTIVQSTQIFDQVALDIFAHHVKQTHNE